MQHELEETRAAAIDCSVQQPSRLPDSNLLQKQKKASSKIASI